MAVIANGQVRRLYAEGQADRVVLYALRNIGTGDTVDLGPSGTGDFYVVKQAAMIGATMEGSATATAAGTVVTMPAGLSGDAIYLLAYGDAAV